MYNKYKKKLILLTTTTYCKNIVRMYTIKNLHALNMHAHKNFIDMYTNQTFLNLSK